MVMVVKSESNVTDSWFRIPASVIQNMGSAIGQTVRREASRGVLQASWACCDDDGCSIMMEAMNRRLGDFVSVADWREVAILERVKGILGESYPLFRLIWEGQKRIRRGVSGHAKYRVTRILGVEEWRALGVRVGCLLCVSGLWVLSSDALGPPVSQTVSEGEVEVQFEMGERAC
jgi:hypothetical protein